jgi:hypothetical protein
MWREHARAVSEASSAKIQAIRTREGDDAADAMFPENDALIEVRREAVMAVALAPIGTKAQLARKKAVVGKVWLLAEGLLVRPASRRGCRRRSGASRPQAGPRA